MYDDLCPHVCICIYIRVRESGRVFEVSYVMSGIGIYAHVRDVRDDLVSFGHHVWDSYVM